MTVSWLWLDRGDGREQRDGEGRVRRLLVPGGAGEGGELQASALGQGDRALHVIELVERAVHPAGGPGEHRVRLVPGHEQDVGGPARERRHRDQREQRQETAAPAPPLRPCPSGPRPSHGPPLYPPNAGCASANPQVRSQARRSRGPRTATRPSPPRRSSPRELRDLGRDRHVLQSVQRGDQPGVGALSRLRRSDRGGRRAGRSAGIRRAPDAAPDARADVRPGPARARWPRPRAPCPPAAPGPRHTGAGRPPDRAAAGRPASERFGA